MNFAFLLLLGVGHIGSVRSFFDGMTAFVTVSLFTSIEKTHGRSVSRAAATGNGDGADIGGR